MRGPELDRGQAGARQMSKCVNISFIIINIQVQSSRAQDPGTAGRTLNLLIKEVYKRVSQSNIHII